MANQRTVMSKNSRSVSGKLSNRDGRKSKKSERNKENSLMRSENWIIIFLGREIIMRLYQKIGAHEVKEGKKEAYISQYGLRMRGSFCHRRI